MWKYAGLGIQKTQILAAHVGTSRLPTVEYLVSPFLSFIQVSYYKYLVEQWMPPTSNDNNIKISHWRKYKRALKLCKENLSQNKSKILFNESSTCMNVRLYEWVHSSQPLNYGNFELDY